MKVSDLRFYPLLKNPQNTKPQTEHQANQNKKTNNIHTKEYHPRGSKLSLFPNCLLRIPKYQLNLLEEG